MAAKTYDEFASTYLAGDEQVIETGPEHTDWPHLIVKAGNKTAVVQLMNVAADDPDAQHLCIDVHSFVDGLAARSAVFGMEVGRRLEGFSDAEAAGTSHGRPAASLTSVLVGKQADTDSRVSWSRLGKGCYIANGGTFTLLKCSATSHKPAGWYLCPEIGEHKSQFMSADETTALERAGALIRAIAEETALMTGGAA